MELSLFNHTLRRAYPCTKIRNGEEERDNEWSFLRSFFLNIITWSIPAGAARCTWPAARTVVTATTGEKHFVVSVRDTVNT